MKKIEMEDNLNMINANATAVMQFAAELSEDAEEAVNSKLHAIYVMADDIFRRSEEMAESLAKED